MKRFELKHGALPAELAALAPEFIPEIPLDPVDGKPLRYRLNPDTMFVLYSVGEDGVDNGGNPTPLRSAAKQWWRGTDAVWPQPATPAQVAEEFARARKQFETSGGLTALEEKMRRRYGLSPNPAPAALTNPAQTAEESIRKRFGLSPAQPAGTNTDTNGSKPKP